jgi:hypothetical protein
MGVFTGLHEMAQSVTAFLRNQGGSFATATHYGQPLENPVSQTEAVRVTLLWVTPQPTHRNDPPHRSLSGALLPPPLTLSAYLLVTTYGGDADPATAYDLLGTTLRLFHETPELSLPIDGVGQGSITVVHVPTAADLMEKIFSPIQLKHRPFALLEVGPIQLVPAKAPTTGAPPVKPGGVGLDVIARPPPTILRITPERQVPGGAVRIDVELHGAPIGQVAIAGSPVASTPIAAPRSYRAIVPATAAGDAVPVAVRTNPLPGQWTDRQLIALLPAGTPSLDAPATATVSITVLSFVLDGRGLATAATALVWPDEGVPSDGDVRELVLSAVTSTSVSILGTELDAKLSGSPTQRSLLGMRLRLVVRLASGTFTPYVLVEVTP